MCGYYKAPELTKEVIDDDGWLHTGDTGIMVEGKYLKITDRKKEVFKLSSGKYVAPQLIENMFKESLAIDQIMIVGEHEKFASALISPNFKYFDEWKKENNISFSDPDEMIRLPEITSLFNSEVEAINKRLSPPERINRFRLVPDEWSPSSGELSPTLKLRRQFISNKYRKLLDQIYMK